MLDWRHNYFDDLVIRCYSDSARFRHTDNSTTYLQITFPKNGSDYVNPFNKAINFTCTWLTFYHAGSLTNYRKAG